MLKLLRSLMRSRMKLAATLTSTAPWRPPLWRTRTNCWQSRQQFERRTSWRTNCHNRCELGNPYVDIWSIRLRLLIGVESIIISFISFENWLSLFQRRGCLLHAWPFNVAVPSLPQHATCSCQSGHDGADRRADDQGDFAIRHALHFSKRQNLSKLLRQLLDNFVQLAAFV